jgi:hypothetical protein
MTTILDTNTDFNWLIKERQWGEISKHPVLRQTDRDSLNLIVKMSRYLLRPAQLHGTKKYERLGKKLKATREREQIARDKLFQIIQNDDLFSALRSHIDLLQIVFGICKGLRVTPECFRHSLLLELVKKEDLLWLYWEIEQKLSVGGPGRKGNSAVSLIRGAGDATGHAGAK